MRYFLISILSLILFSGCQQKKENLSRTWFFEKATFREGITLYEADQINPMQLDESSFLNLYEDGSYTSYFGSFSEGKWKLKSDTLRLHPSHTPWLIVPFKVEKIAGQTMELYYEPRKAVYTFSGVHHDIRLKSSEDPFSFQNNLWRIRPDQPETDEQILKRLKNHFRFYELYFSWGKRTSQEYIKVNAIPGPFRIYGNGFELVHYSEQHNEWKQSFYDTADVRKAYHVLYYFLYKHDINWDEKAERYDMFASAFRQLRQGLQ